MSSGSAPPGSGATRMICGKPAAANARCQARHARLNVASVLGRDAGIHVIGQRLVGLQAPAVDDTDKGIDAAAVEIVGWLVVKKPMRSSSWRAGIGSAGWRAKL